MTDPARLLAPEKETRLVGVGLYTLAEAGRLVQVRPGRIARWLSGHQVGGAVYEPLWRSQVDLGDAGVFLGFRDLLQVRVAAQFIELGVSAQRVREAIRLAADITGDDHPLARRSFRTDGRTIFLQMAESDQQPKLIDLFSRQYAFREIVEQSLSDVEFDPEGVPRLWWPLGRAKGVVIDPTRAFGQPVEEESSVPTSVLAAADRAEASQADVARIWQVPVRAVRRAVFFEAALAQRLAA